MASSSSSSYINLVAVLLVLSSAATVLSTSHRDAQAPAPAVDCSGLILTMADCLSFVSNGSKVDKPEGTCCSGLKTVLKTNAECLCDAFKSAAQLGVVLNISKAITLPSACKLSAASAAKCYLSIVPAAAPGAEAPVSSPTSIATAPTSSVGVNAPPPGNSATSSLISLPSLALATATALAASWCFV